MKTLPENLLDLVEGAIEGQSNSVARACQSFSQSLSPEVFIKTVEEMFAHNMRVIAERAFEAAQKLQPTIPPFPISDWSGYPGLPPVGQGSN